MPHPIQIHCSVTIYVEGDPGKPHQALDQTCNFAKLVRQQMDKFVAERLNDDELYVGDKGTHLHPQEKRPVISVGFSAPKEKS